MCAELENWPWRTGDPGDTPAWRVTERTGRTSNKRLLSLLAKMGVAEERYTGRWNPRSRCYMSIERQEVLREGARTRLVAWRPTRKPDTTRYALAWGEPRRLTFMCLEPAADGLSASARRLVTNARVDIIGTTKFVHDRRVKSGQPFCKKDSWNWPRRKAAGRGATSANRLPTWVAAGLRAAAAKWQGHPHDLNVDSLTKRGPAASVGLEVVVPDRDGLTQSVMSVPSVPWPPRAEVCRLPPRHLPSAFNSGPLEC